MLPQYTTKDVTRFWPKVDKSGECWLWTGCKIRRGYGRFRLEDSLILAHRFAYAITYGDLTDDLCVLHRCDNPSCVRPDHLFLGTNADNVADRAAKKRSSGGRLYGKKNKATKLTAEQVHDIRYRCTNGESQRRLAQEYGISQGHVSDIVLRKKRQHIDLCTDPAS